MAKIDKMCQKSAFLVVPSQNHWKWPTLSKVVQAPWSKKSYFSDFSNNIWYLYIGAVSFTGGWAILFKKKKIWTVPLILQFNIYVISKLIFTDIFWSYLIVIWNVYSVSQSVNNIDLRDASASENLSVGQTLFPVQFFKTGFLGETKLFPLERIIEIEFYRIFCRATANSELLILSRR